MNSLRSLACQDASSHALHVVLVLVLLVTSCVLVLVVTSCADAVVTAAAPNSAMSGHVAPWCPCIVDADIAAAPIHSAMAAVGEPRRCAPPEPQLTLFMQSCNGSTRFQVSHDLSIIESIVRKRPAVAVTVRFGPTTMLASRLSSASSSAEQPAYLI